MTKILLVDDSPSQRELILELLEKHQFSVTVASDGVDALEKLEQFCPDLILSDVVMPRLNGYAFCRQVKANPTTQSVPVVICSSKGTEADVYWGLKQGADAYIAKPFKPADLIATIKQLLHQ